MIITSSYPAISGESFEGGCVESFAKALTQYGHNVIILTQCVGKNYYKNSNDIIVKRFQWTNHPKPLSVLNLKHDIGKICLYFSRGISESDKVVREHKIDVVICAWALPAGLFGLYLKKRYSIPYIIWALGSDLWNYTTLSLPHLLLRKILSSALDIYADGQSLIDILADVFGRRAKFLPTSRELPNVVSQNIGLNDEKVEFLYVGRYHVNRV